MTRRPLALAIVIGIGLQIAAASAPASMNVVTRAMIIASAARSTVALQLFNDDGVDAICSGVILSEDTVVTAAHCLDGATRAKVLFGEDAYHPRAMRWAHSGSIPSSMNLIVPRMRYDAAYVHFSGGLPAGYKPAQILPREFELLKGQPILVAGYGKTSLKKEDDGTYREKRLRVLDRAYSPLEVKVEQRAPESACPGDSGGPAFVVIQGQAWYWGIVNAGFGVSEPCGDFMIFSDFRNPDLQQSMSEQEIPLRAGN